MAWDVFQRSSFLFWHLREHLELILNFSWQLLLLSFSFCSGTMSQSEGRKLGKAVRYMSTQHLYTRASGRLAWRPHTPAFTEAALRSHSCAQPQLCLKPSPAFLCLQVCIRGRALVLFGKWVIKLKSLKEEFCEHEISLLSFPLVIFCR